MVSGGIKVNLQCRSHRIFGHIGTHFHWDILVHISTGYLGETYDPNLSLSIKIGLKYTSEPGLFLQTLF